ncbi:uncharacterized protein (TIGR02677 family) [Allocatelliglobosispora scoriae]|uniref:Uncharacterized protein (TIGR02677 family) n=1 Tax=Allocatelliglobosispora scoriae TaxID=643052 RepID=A0A841BN33_9ACTN|nr:TIGR02677 family protein [Allocatelliglobosispora scoriae]MBB5868599.1 uncharacterized protein (TIGR02677 family) [Allocatelliglobosispora scoriae]
MSMPPESAPQPFAHLQTPLTPLYREILTAFVRAKQRFVVHLRPEDVAVDLGRPADVGAIGSALESLSAWKNLRQDPDTSRVTTVEDFQRARYLYQLTAEGHAAEQAISVYEESIGRRGSLQSVALADIAGQLQALLVIASESAGGHPPDAAKCHLLLIGVVDRFTGLADNAQAFMASLRRAIDFADADIEAFVAYKERLITYIERFIADLANLGAEIAGLTQQIEAAGVESLLGVAARRDAADAVPEDKSDEAFDQAFEDSLAVWHSRWRGLREWFVSADARRPSQARLLRSAALGAITQMLGAVNAINERRAGRSDRAADFRTLAVWFAQSPDDEAAHRLWRAAFGLTPSRHLSVTAPTLEKWETERVSSATPWQQAPRLAISPQLRRTGSYERRGQPNRVVDRTEARLFLADQAEQESRQTAAARATLATTQPVLLSQLGDLDPIAFRLFLQLLGDALAARGPRQDEVVTTTGDGTMRVGLTAVPGARWVRIATADGVLEGPEHYIEITDLTAERSLP